MNMNATMTTTCRVTIAVRARMPLRILPNWLATMLFRQHAIMNATNDLMGWGEMR